MNRPRPCCESARTLSPSLSASLSPLCPSSSRYIPAPCKRGGPSARAGPAGTRGPRGSLESGRSAPGSCSLAERPCAQSDSTLSFCLSLSLFFSLCLSLSLARSLALSLSVSLSLSLSLPHSLSELPDTQTEDRPEPLRACKSNQTLSLSRVLQRVGQLPQAQGPEQPPGPEGLAAHGWQPRRRRRLRDSTRRRDLPAPCPVGVGQDTATRTGTRRPSDNVTDSDTEAELESTADSDWMAPRPDPSHSNPGCCRCSAAARRAGVGRAVAAAPLSFQCCEPRVLATEGRRRPGPWPPHSMAAGRSPASTPPPGRARMIPSPWQY